MGCAYLFVVLVTLVSINSTYSIMVKFGTNDGPIVPPPPSTTGYPAVRERRDPAPVFERREDVPNPTPYKPYLPQQYRSKLLSFKPNPNLILGTAQDQKYFGKSSQKFTLLKQQQARALGLEYKGPQVFELQDYELVKPRVERPLFQPAQAVEDNSRIDTATKYVPQIGILYSSGVRYYIPQIVYYNEESLGENNYYNRKPEDKTNYLLYNTV